ncbi:MAG: hypothetical protein JSR23_04580 [Proteobacteria bacterium]|nr:hypothetical protein [Pseudomonadota bacterium]
MGLEAGFIAPQAASRVAVASAQVKGARRERLVRVCMVFPFFASGLKAQQLLEKTCCHSGYARKRGLDAAGALAVVCARGQAKNAVTV